MARRPIRCHRQWWLSRKRQERVQRARWASSRWWWAPLPPSITQNRTRPTISINPSRAIEAIRNYARSSSPRSIATSPAREPKKNIAAVAGPFLPQWTTHRCFWHPHISRPRNHSRNRPVNLRTGALRTLQFKKWDKWSEGNETCKWPKVISSECWRSSVTRRRRHMSKFWRKVSKVELADSLMICMLLCSCADLSNIERVPGVIADDRILKGFKTMQGNKMQRELKQRLLIERSGRIALPMVRNTWTNLLSPVSDRYWLFAL